MDKINDLILDTCQFFEIDYWKTRVWRDKEDLKDDVEFITRLNDKRRGEIVEVRFDLWAKKPEIRSDIFYANISKCLTNLWKKEMKSIDSLQKDGDSLLFRCTNLNLKDSATLESFKVLG
ncbi:MAG: hypothetical protein AAGE99_01555 [Chlamydiota bacterium]